MMCGAVAARIWLRDIIPEKFALLGVLTQTGTRSAFVCLAGTLGVLWAAAAAMSDLPVTEAGSAFRTMLLQTSIGRLGIASLALLVPLFAIQFVGRRRPGMPVLLILLGAYAYSRAASSHAAEQGIVGIAVMVEWLHLLCASLWIGVVLLSAWLLIPNTSRAQGDDLILRQISRTATMALAGVALTGIYNAWRGVGEVGNLVGNPYATALMCKLAFIALAVTLGAFNRYAGFPALAHSAAALPLQTARGRVLLVLRIESLALLAALVAAAVLTGEVPPAAD